MLLPVGWVRLVAVSKGHATTTTSKAKISVDALIHMETLTTKNTTKVIRVEEKMVSREAPSLNTDSVFGKRNENKNTKKRKIFQCGLMRIVLKHCIRFAVNLSVRKILQRNFVQRTTAHLCDDEDDERRQGDVVVVVIVARAGNQLPRLCTDTLNLVKTAMITETYLPPCGIDCCFGASNAI